MESQIRRKKIVIYILLLCLLFIINIDTLVISSAITIPPSIRITITLIVLIVNLTDFTSIDVEWLECLLTVNHFKGACSIIIYSSFPLTLEAFTGHRHTIQQDPKFSRCNNFIIDYKYLQKHKPSASDRMSDRPTTRDGFASPALCSPLHSIEPPAVADFLLYTLPHLSLGGLRPTKPSHRIFE